MAIVPPALRIDFGEVGYHGRKQRFSLTLDASPLAELIAHAHQAHRVYELMLIDRPGDVWDYVWVAPGSMPDFVRWRFDRPRAEAQPRFAKTHPWPDGKVPFVVFDRGHQWAGDDTTPEDEAWLSHRDSPAMRAFAAQWLATAKMAQEELDRTDPLLRHEIDRFRRGDHDYAFLERRDAIAKGRQHPPTEPLLTADFYDKLDELLRDPELPSVAYRGDGDYKVLRMLCAEQRRRVDATGRPPREALHLCALIDRQVNTTAWGAEVFFYDEGLGPGDLFIEERSLGASIKELVEVHSRRPRRGFLCRKDEGPIAGYSVERGDGWFFYRRLRVPE
jgi:hypothetical protein